MGRTIAGVLIGIVLAALVGLIVTGQVSPFWMGFLIGAVAFCIVGILIGAVAATPRW